MGLFRPNRPAAPTPSHFILFCQMVWDYLFGGKFPFIDTDSVKWHRGPNGYAAAAFLPSAGGSKETVTNGGYLGEYDITKKYSSGSIIRKTTGTTTGVFGVRLGMTAKAGVQPTFPENPAGPWDFIAFLPQVVGVCSNGQKLIYVQSSLPF